MSLADGPPKRLPSLGNEDQVNVIRHQAIGPDADALPAAHFCEKIAIKFVVIRAEKHLLASVAALRHEVGKTGDDKTSDASQRMRAVANPTKLK